MLYDVSALEFWIATVITVVGAVAVILIPYSSLGYFGKRITYAIECVLLLASAGIVITHGRIMGFPWERDLAFLAYFYFAIVTVLPIVLIVLARIVRKKYGLMMQNKPASKIDPLRQELRV